LAVARPAQHLERDTVHGLDIVAVDDDGRQAIGPARSAAGCSTAVTLRIGVYSM